jgi:UDP-N-acetylmuramyl pentapeptide synthase
LKHLKDLLYNVAIDAVFGATDIAVSQLVFDSRAVKADAVFVAQKGVTVDGHNYIQTAIDNGATVIICEVMPPKRP